MVRPQFVLESAPKEPAALSFFILSGAFCREGSLHFLKVARVLWQKGQPLRMTKRWVTQ